MADDADIAFALTGGADGLSIGSPKFPVAYPEVKFTPPVDSKGGPAPYLRVDLFMNRPAWVGLSDGKLSQGLLQVTVVWPRLDGLIAPARVVDAVRAYFYRGRVLRHGTARVVVAGEPWAASPLSEDKSVLVPVTIPWRA